MKIFIMTGDVGEYEDHITYIVGYTKTEEEAKKLIDTANEQMKEVYDEIKSKVTDDKYFYDIKNTMKLPEHYIDKELFDYIESSSKTSHHYSYKETEELKGEL